MAPLLLCLSDFPSLTSVPGISTRLPLSQHTGGGSEEEEADELFFCPTQGWRGQREREAEGVVAHSTSGGRSLGQKRPGGEERERGEGRKGGGGDVVGQFPWGEPPTFPPAGLSKLNTQFPEKAKERHRNKAGLEVCEFNKLSLPLPHPPISPSLSTPSPKE